MPRIVPILLMALAALAVLSLHLGIEINSPAEVWRALTGDEQDTTTLIIRGLRVPRLALAICVGAALGLSGLLMQTATRNPIAEPGLLGVNAGAAFAVVVAITVAGGTSLGMLTVVSAAGAFAAAAAVFLLTMGSPARSSTVHMLLAGVTVAAFLSAGTQTLVIVDEVAFEELLFWLSGAFADRPAEGLVYSTPVILVTFAAAMANAATLDVLQTDETTAEALGIPVRRTRLAVLAAASLLAGSCVAMAGPIAFIGLTAPHFARFCGLRDHSALIPVSALFGAVLAVAADIVARFVIYPTDAPISAVTALVGVPALIVLLKRKRTGAA